MPEPPRTRYALSGDAHIAYQVFGGGDLDLVFVPGFVSNIEHYWDMPRVPDLLERLGSFARVALFDKRGTGLSDPVPGPPPLEQRMDDMQAVMGLCGRITVMNFAFVNSTQLTATFNIAGNAATGPRNVTVTNGNFGTDVIAREMWQQMFTPPGNFGRASAQAIVLLLIVLVCTAVVFALFLSTLMVPAEATFIPNFLTISEWGLHDTYLGLVLPFLAYAFGTFLLRQSFKQFPVELYDAARIDGMGHLRFLWTVLLPLNKPALMAVGVYVFITSWNMYFWPLIITRSTEMQTLQIGLYTLTSAVDAGSTGLMLAGAVLSVLPTLALVIFGQRFIIRGLTAGALK